MSGHAELAILEGFEPVDLAGLNARSELLRREDRKYLTHWDSLPAILASLRQDFQVLEHAGKRVFRYETVYFDEDFKTYRDHLQGRRRRFKVRTRLYADSGRCTFEMKVKRGRGETDKRRISYPADERWDVNDEAWAFIRSSYREAFGQDLPVRGLKPYVNIITHRITLVARGGGERVTIDFGMRFENHASVYVPPQGCVIIETKTRKGCGRCGTVLREHHLRPVSSLSKYCIGIVGNRLVAKRNEFLPVLRRMERIEELAVRPTEILS